VVKVVKIVKVESVKKEVRGYWEKTLFLIIGIVLLWIIKLMAILRKKRTTVMKGIHYVIFSVITVVSFLIITKSVMASNLSLINSIIMGIVFIAFGIFIKRKK